MITRNRAAKDRAALEAATVEQDHAPYVLRLYVAGATGNSARAIVNIRKLCEEYLPGRYELQVIDISSDPAMAANEQIIAAPTLIKQLPLPLRRFIGDMSKTERILVGLDVRPTPTGVAPD
jgi:circadian clock protein KaiB